jgi:anti-sigma B factor antagonist
MKSIIENNERYIIFTVKEDHLDQHEATDLKSEIAIQMAEGHTSILLDMSQVNTMDTHGIDALLNADRSAKVNNGFVVVFGLNQEIYNLIKIAKLDKVLTITHTLAEAEDLLIMEELERDLDLFGDEEEAF